MKGNIKIGILLVLVALLAIGSVSALPDVEYIKINGDQYENGDSVVVEKGDDLEIKVKLQADVSYDNLEVEADIIGYEYNDIDEISDSTHTFDVDAGDTVYKELDLTIPSKADKDYYDLRIRVSGRTGSSVEYLMRVNLKGSRHDLEVKRVMLHPSNAVDAGSYLLVNAKITNRGEESEEEDVRVTARIEDLDLEDTTYINEIEEDESKTSEELFLRIPACAEAGIYEVEVEVAYDEDSEVVTEIETIEIRESDLCNAADDDTESVISVGSQTQQVTAGEGGATYSLSITNPSNSDRSYTLSVSGLDSWGTFRVDPATTQIVKAGETEAMFVFVSAKDDATEGQQSFVVNVVSGDESEAVQFYANVVKDESNIRKWAEFVLIALVVLLIILGLIVGFSRMRNKPEDDEDEDLTGQTYY